MVSIRELQNGFLLPKPEPDFYLLFIERLIITEPEMIVLKFVHKYPKSTRKILKIFLKSANPFFSTKKLLLKARKPADKF